MIWCKSGPINSHLSFLVSKHPKCDFWVSVGFFGFWGRFFCGFAFNKNGSN